MATLAPSLLELLAEVDAAYPGRSHLHDAWERTEATADIGKAHVPDELGRVWDIDFDSTDLDGFLLARAIVERGDIIQFVIHRNVIWSRNFDHIAHVWHGDRDPYQRVVHVSLRRDPRAWAGGLPWGIADLTVPTGPGASRLQARTAVHFTRGADRVATGLNATAARLAGLSRQIQARHTQP